MRKIDKNKQRAIKQAVFDLSQSEGLFNMTTAKIAKTAGVSPATIYLYYQDKTDLLSRIYEEVKTNLHDGLDKVINLEDRLDRKSTRLNSSHVSISYAVFCLKKKKKNMKEHEKY